MLNATTTIRAVSLTHGDVGASINVLVEWPDHATGLPTFVLGDFGDARLWNKERKAGRSSKPHFDVHWDVREVLNLIDEAVGVPDTDQSGEDTHDGISSFIDAIRSASSYFDTHDDYDALESQINRVQYDVDQHLATKLADSATNNALRPNYYPSPRMITHPTIEALWGNPYRPPEPWRIAEINHASRKIIPRGDMQCSDSFKVTRMGIPQGETSVRTASGLSMPHVSLDGTELTPNTREVWRYGLRKE